MATQNTPDRGSIPDADAGAEVVSLDAARAAHPAPGAGPVPGHGGAGDGGHSDPSSVAAPAPGSDLDEPKHLATGSASPDWPVLEGTAVRVDQPGGEHGDWLADLANRARERRPIIAPWLRSRREALATLRWLVAHYVHVSAYHAVRVPKYGSKLAVRTPRGMARLVSGTVRWTFDLEGHPVRMAAVTKADPEAYLKLSRQRDSRVRLRVWIAGLAPMPGT